ncbi:winged helix-turn-helix transcriptional regulator [Nocardioides sp. JQ2195]|uniref:winged helix-turn-helix domain-containing protein n=1 Tax=Nocardioides sp. JQ2195 TaxID=2592334 RepID=UPI00143E1921|nr:winged helix-turn-helix domain-containing protein [Nocardioides sp. JQ2195]QIX27283.1 winged helix-turn-helix transcriptional regulator [Nocardioides sp. JQ2195]
MPDGAQAVVIAIAGSIEERLRIAEMVGSSAAVVMVSSRAEAMDILAGSPGVRSEPERPRPGLAVAEQSSGLEVDSDWRVATVGDREVGLSPLEHDLLVCLLAEVGHIHTFESIQRSVWGNDHLGGRSHVQSVVKRLRRKLGDLDSPVQIDAVRGVGLRLVDVGRTRAPEGAAAPLPVPVPLPRKLPPSPTDPRLVRRSASR